MQGATSIHHVNPALLIEKILRERIFESLYWKEYCFGLTVATLCDRAVELQYVGGTYANHRVTPFICVLFKLVLLQPRREIVMEYLNQQDFKYLRALAAFYIRLFYVSEEVYQLLEPFLGDYRKLRMRSIQGVTLTYMDEFIDSLLTQERVCEIALPRMTKRIVLEDAGKLEPKTSLVASESSSSDDSDSDSDWDTCNKKMKK